VLLLLGCVVHLPRPKPSERVLKQRHYRMVDAEHAIPFLLDVKSASTLAGERWNQRIVFLIGVPFYVLKSGSGRAR